MTTKISAMTASSGVATGDQFETCTSANATRRTTIDQIVTYLTSIFTSLQFGGTSASFPMLKRSTTTLQVKLADDSAFTQLDLLKENFGGLTTNTVTMQCYQTTVTVANGATSGKETSIAMPAYFLPLFVSVHITVAATNAVNLVDIGVEGDTDCYVDGNSVAVNSTGFKGVWACNGIRGNPGGTTNTGGGLGTPDEVAMVVSADPGATGVTARLTFYGVVAA